MPVLVSHIKYSTIILSRLVAAAHQISNKTAKDTIKGWHQKRSKKQLTVTVGDNKNVLWKLNTVQKVLFGNVWQNLATFHQKHTLPHQKAIGKNITTYNHTKSFKKRNKPFEISFRFEEQEHTSSTVTVVHWKKYYSLFTHQ